MHAGIPRVEGGGPPMIIPPIAGGFTWGSLGRGTGRYLPVSHTNVCSMDHRDWRNHAVPDTSLHNAVTAVTASQSRTERRSGAEMRCDSKEWVSRLAVTGLWVPVKVFTSTCEGFHKHANTCSCNYVANSALMLRDGVAMGRDSVTDVTAVTDTLIMLSHSTSYIYSHY